VNPEQHETVMAAAVTTNFYLQNSQQGGINGKSPLSKPTSESDDSDALSDTNESFAAGRRDPEVYERTLQSWRAAIRRPIVRMVEKESHIIAAMQVL
jgi:hypothetical protein